MKGNITRRDFLNGTQVAIGGSFFMPSQNLFGTSSFSLPNDYYPPALTGLRGSHDGSWEVMHSKVLGKQWKKSKYEEKYDLVVVGAGISGLSSAYHYKKTHPEAKILLIDNHDDFGGHAKRNEFEVNGETRIGYGGTEAIDTPSSYSQEAKSLIKEIGIDVEKFYEAYDQSLYSSLGLGKGILFDSNSFSEERLVTGYNKVPWKEFAEKTPMTQKAKDDLVRIWTEKKDYLPILSDEEKYELLKNLSYYDFLKDYVKVDQQILEIFRRWGMSFWCVGIDEVPCTLIQNYDGGMPGLDYTLKRSGYRGDEPYIFHFPDGNASVARLLVRALIPGSVPGSSMEDVVLAKVNYSLLDGDSTTKIRLNSTVVDVSHTNNSSAVDITYVRKHDVHTIRADKCILACYNSAIPYLCSELPKKQVDGLKYNVKIPLTYTKVMIPSWKVFADLGLDFVYYTDAFYKQVELAYPVSIGDYKFNKSPDESMVLHMCHSHHSKDIKGPDQWREGRRRLLSTPFSVYEGHVKDQLDSALGGGGFDSDRDISAITVNRWPHGYSYSNDLIWEPDWENEESKPWVIGRQQYGRISIANSDAGASADTNSAITHGIRAAQEALSI
ncbi:MAG: NAD(P)/FAD-dependent oxidoreductase [Gammaproteobacteria bacterium]|nr:MAG: NAD(P)/FAD-dependent oxidoreductase [Gammaproteobacteria bacterium]